MQIEKFVWVAGSLVAFVCIILLLRKLKQERIQNQYLEDLNTQKDKLFTVIGHDLNSFVNVGHAGLQLYRTGGLPEQERQELLDNLEEKYMEASIMLQSFLNWGKQLLKGISIQPQTFSADQLIRMELEMSQAIITRKRIKIINALPESLDVHADLDQFKFIIRNLLSNAIKFTRIEGVIRIKLHDQLHNGFTIIGVVDNGVGMSDEKLKQIFYPFNKSTEGTAKEKGNGIGLMLCKDYARANGGDIWAHSISARGTTFYLALKSTPHSRVLPAVTEEGRLF